MTGMNIPSISLVTCVTGVPDVVVLLKSFTTPESVALPFIPLISTSTHLSARAYMVPISLLIDSLIGTSLLSSVDLLSVLIFLTTILLVGIARLVPIVTTLLIVTLLSGMASLPLLSTSAMLDGSTDVSPFTVEVVPVPVSFLSSPLSDIRASTTVEDLKQSLRVHPRVAIALLCRASTVTSISTIELQINDVVEFTVTSELTPGDRWTSVEKLPPKNPKPSTTMGMANKSRSEVDITGLLNTAGDGSLSTRFTVIHTSTSAKTTDTASSTAPPPRLEVLTSRSLDALVRSAQLFPPRVPPREEKSVPLLVSLLVAMATEPATRSMSMPLPLYTPVVDVLMRVMYVV